MKLFRLMLTIIAAGFAFAAVAQAADAPAPAASSPPSTITAPSANAAAKLAPKAGGALTAEDAKKICQFRSKGDSKKYDGCMKHHQKNIGKEISKGDAKTLDKIHKKSAGAGK